MKIVVFLLLFLTLILGSLAQNRQSRKVVVPSKRSRSLAAERVNITCDTNVRLLGLSDSGLKILHPANGVVRIDTLLASRSGIGVCAPKDFDHFKQIVLLSHVVCRQLGYMTYAALRRTDRDRFHHSSQDKHGEFWSHAISPTSWKCSGHEQAICQCSWNNLSINRCRHLMEVTCGDCHNTIKDSEGFIQTLGYPATYLYDLTCKWTIEVPEYHTILLTVSGQSETVSDNETFACESCKPYIEIIYGHPTDKAYFKIDRLYNITEPKNLSIPHHKTEIVVFSGLYRDKFEKLENKGFLISFKAIPYETSDDSYTVISALIIASFVAFGVGCFCIGLKKKKQESYVKKETKIFHVPIEDVDNHAYEFKKCKPKGKENRAHGLRLRTHNSSPQEERKEVTVISSLADVETVEEYCTCSAYITPHPGIANGMQNCKPSRKRRILAKVNLLNRYSRSNHSTPRCQSCGLDKASKGDSASFKGRNSNKDRDGNIFNFDIQTVKEDSIFQPEQDTSVFLPSVSVAPKSDSFRARSFPNLPFRSPKPKRK